MVDIVDARTRSRMMAAIRSRNTAPEILVRQYLHATGLRFRLHDRRLPGTPDICLPKYQTAVFVHGCFWHRHPACRFATTPSSRENFWTQKFSANVARDQAKAAALRAAGWQVLVVWACQLSEPSALDALFFDIVGNLP